MLGLGISIAEAGVRGRSPYADHALALDFRNKRYRQAALLTADAAALAGYSYRRDGQKWELRP